jgi:hypothetical protein
VKGNVLTKNSNLNRREMVIGVLVLPWVAVQAAPSRELIEVWKTPTCGCCKDWISHLENEGFDVKTYMVSESTKTAQRSKIGIPEKMGSCHTALVKGYALEGHVPGRDIRRLLNERPRALGLAVPGMPVGSPGMDGPEYGGRKDPYNVLLVQRDGSSSVFHAYS